LAVSVDLKARLDDLYTAYNAEHVVSDPIWIVRRYARRDDQEVVGFCAAALAFGRVQSVLNSIEALLAVMGPQPAAYVRAFDPARDRAALAHLVHRWTRGVDLAALVWILKQRVDRSGSIEAFFAERLDSDHETIEHALDAFSERACNLNVKAVYGTRVRKPGVAYFFARPSSGGACKRLNLFLRWMVRNDAVDLGTWTRVRRAQLVVPLDTHVIRLGRCLRLTKYASPGWRMAADITRSLRAFDADDPVKYDFSLCHVGMMNGCGYGRAAGDRSCPLRGACRPLKPSTTAPPTTPKRQPPRTAKTLK
jgi:uncharacterized protein (TIGR02757 family)